MSDTEKQPEKNPENKDAVKKKREAWDQYETCYECKELLDQGGQGKVWITNHSNTLVKTNNDKDTDKKKRWFNHVQWVLRQDLEGLSIAAPKALVLRPVPGYVMELMDGLHPLALEMERSYLELTDGKGLNGFLRTGGLKRRLLMLSELANTLSRLHAKGLAFGDLSPNNIFVSKSVNHSRAWLIDCDNICTNERSGWGHLHTPGYGAAEVVRGESGVNSLSDAWSFAVIAYQLLTLQHPLVGLLVEDGEPELEEKAFRGELPWVNDSKDESNEQSGGIPMQMIASPKMQELFHKCFEEGKLGSWNRPSMSEWSNVLDDAISRVQQCHNNACNSTYIKNKACPFCNEDTDPEKSVLLTAFIYSQDPELDRNLISTGFGRVLNKDETVDLKRVPAGTELFREADEVCQVRFDEDGLAIKVMPGNKFTLSVSGRQQEITRGFKLDIEKKQGQNYFLHLTPPNGSDQHETHPVWAFRW